MLLSGCSTNPATGEQQFTALMPATQEAAIGAAEHEKIIAQYGGVYKNAALQDYVNDIGQRLAKDTERTDVTYKFTILDSPVVNAFALPGGYIYVTRGTLALANDEAELAGVLGHEIGHVTARHQAARFSEGMLTQLGAGILAAVVKSPALNQAVGLGANLYLSSYSRSQESQADQLGIRYLNRAGYDRDGMARFLAHMGQYKNTEARLQDKQQAAPSYFSSHPDTGLRVAEARAEAATYPPSSANVVAAAPYLKAINGMTFGDSASQGFLRGLRFHHPQLGFTLKFPQGYHVDNAPSHVVAKGKDGGIILFDMNNRPSLLDNPADYISGTWLKGQYGGQPERININGMDAATLSIDGTIKNQPVEVRLVAIAYSPRQFVRLQMVIPKHASPQMVEEMKRTTYSFRPMTADEERRIRPYQIGLVTAKSGDTLATMAQKMNIDNPEDYFMALNASDGKIVPGRMYKIIK